MLIKKIKENLFTLSIILTLVAFIEVVFRPPSSIERFVYENIPMDRIKSKEISVPQLPKLDSYLKTLAGKRVFQIASRKEEEAPTLTNLGDYEFNGMVTLDKPYAAVFKKSTQEQFLVSEGGTVNGIKIKKIERGFAVIELYGEERKIIF